MSEGTLELSNLVFIRKKNGSAMILLTKYTKIQDSEKQFVFKGYRTSPSGLSSDGRFV